jgi:hypothetical protein
MHVLQAGCRPRFNARLVVAGTVTLSYISIEQRVRPTPDSKTDGGGAGIYLHNGADVSALCV